MAAPAVALAGPDPTIVGAFTVDTTIHSHDRLTPPIPATRFVDITNEDLCYAAVQLARPSRAETLSLNSLITTTNSLPSTARIHAHLKHGTPRELQSTEERETQDPSISVSANIDSGAAPTLIRSSVALALQVPIYHSKQGITMNDVNGGQSNQHTHCYVQVRFPPSNVHCVCLATVIEDLSLPFLLGASDLRALKATVDHGERKISFAGITTGLSVPMLPHAVWTRRIAAMYASTSSAIEDPGHARITNWWSSLLGPGVSQLDVLSSTLQDDPSRDPSMETLAELQQASEERQRTTEASQQAREQSEDILNRGTKAYATFSELRHKVPNPRKLEYRITRELESDLIEELGLSRTQAHIKAQAAFQINRSRERQAEWDTVREKLKFRNALFGDIATEDSDMSEDENSDGDILEARVNLKVGLAPCRHAPLGVPQNSTLPSLQHELRRRRHHYHPQAVRALQAYLTAASQGSEQIPDSLLRNDNEVNTIPVLPTEDELHATGDPSAVPTAMASALADYLFDGARLATIQKQEQSEHTEHSDELASLQAEVNLLLEADCTDSQHDARPPDFPSDLWRYVFDSEKPKVKARFAAFPTPVREPLIKEILEDLDINTSRPLGVPFMRAQALANLDVFGFPDPGNPPKVPDADFTMPLLRDKPVYVRHQKFSQHESAFLDAKIYELVQRGKLEPSTSQYNTNLVLVPYTERINASIEKWRTAGLDATKEMFRPENYGEVSTWYRLTNNFKPINEISLPFRYIMPDQEDVIHHTRGSRYWSSTDIRDAFFVVNLAPEDRHKTAFTTPRGRFQYTVLPQGTSNAPMFFSWVANRTFSHIPKGSLINFIDDTTNHSRHFKPHLLTQQEMYDALRANKLVLKIAKSHFLYPSVRILGHIYSEHGRTPDPSLVKAVLDLAPPQDVKGVRHLLGLAVFNREYIPHYSEITKPLQDLTKNGVDVAADWSPEVHGKALQALKHALTTAPCLLTVDPSKPFTIHVDACKTGRGPGAVLLQQDSKANWRPVAYFSVRLRNKEHTWSATELEAMGLVYAIRHWSKYLRIQRFTAIVDHSALVWLVNQPERKTANGRLLHWISDLLEYNFEVYHRAGTKHLDADALSRLLRQQDLPVQRSDPPDIADALDGPLTLDDLAAMQKQLVYHGTFLEIAQQSLESNLAQTTVPKVHQLFFNLLLTALAADTEDERITALREARDLISHVFPEDTDTSHTVPISEQEASNLTSDSTPEQVDARLAPTGNCDTEKDRWDRLLTPTDGYDTEEDNYEEDESCASESDGEDAIESTTALDPYITQVHYATRSRVAAEHPSEDEALEDTSPHSQEKAKATGTGRPRRSQHTPRLHTLYPTKAALLALDKARTATRRRSTLRRKKQEQTASAEAQQPNGANNPGTTLVHEEPQSSSSEPAVIEGEINSSALPDNSEINQPETETAGLAGNEPAELRYPTEAEDPQASEVDQQRHRSPSAKVHRAQRILEQTFGTRAKQTLARPSSRTCSQTPVLLRDNFKATAKTRGRPRSLSITSLPLPERRSNANYITDHPLVRQYKHLEDSYFEDPTTHRIYTVVLVFYDPLHQTVAAFRRSADDDPEDPLDAHPWRVEGEHGIAELVKNFQDPWDGEIQTPWPTSEEEMLALQKDDPQWQETIQLLSGPQMEPEIPVQWPGSSKFMYLARTATGVGALRLLGPDGTCRASDKVVLPVQLRRTAVTFYHDQQGHPGRIRTIMTLQQLYWWPRLAQDVTDYVHSCSYCNTHKGYNQAAQVPIHQNANLPTHPFSVVHMDLTGASLPTTKRGNKYILVVKDSLTRYVEIYPLRNKEPITVAQLLVDHIYCRHGAISTLVSDQGTEFLNKVITQVCALLRINKVTTAPHAPRSNGLVENHNRTLKDQLAGYTSAFQDDWDLYLPLVAFTYNTTVNSTTGYSPYFLLHGREASQPHSQWISRTCQEIGPNNIDQYAFELAQRLSFLWDQLAISKVDEAKKFNRTPLKPRDFKEYEKGDLFFLKMVPDATYTHYLNPKEKRPISAKLQHRWVGPFEVEEKLTPVTYMARINGTLKKIHAISMKPLKSAYKYYYLSQKKEQELDTDSLNLIPEDIGVTPGDVSIAVNKESRSLARQLLDPHK